MRSLIAQAVLLVLVSVVSARNVLLDDLWETYKLTFQKKYDTGEEPVRRLVWESNVDVVRRHNLEYDLGQHTYTLGINEYADLSQEEYRKYLLGARSQTNSSHSDGSRLLFTPNPRFLDLPDTVDWRTKGYVTPVKNQGRCGSCWAFSSTGAMEGAHFKATGQLISLSEQQLIDCCKYNAGCNGGWMDNAFKYVVENGGIDTETYYPYQARATGRCTYNPEDLGTKVSSFVDVKKGDEQALKEASATQGPIAVAIDASHKSFQLYKSGVYVEPACSSKSTDHAVLVVGYGTEQGQDYWLVKNSWGESWGTDGYIKMARNHDNQCAIASFASYPIAPSN